MRFRPPLPRCRFPLLAATPRCGQQSARRRGRGVHAECAAALGSPYLQWDLGDPELAVAGTLCHGFEWAFVRVAPALFLAAAAAALFARERMR